MTFYAKAFGQDVPHFITYGEGDTSFDQNVQMSGKGKGLIMFTSLNIAGTRVNFNDMPDNFDSPAGFMPRSLGRFFEATKNLLCRI